jgi:hypothetical protein
MLAAVCDEQLGWLGDTGLDASVIWGSAISR